MRHPHSDQSAVTLSVKVTPKIRNQLKDLADITGSTKSFLAAKAIEYYLTTQAWQMKATEKAIKKANSKKAKFIDHDDVASWLNSWGTKEEEEPPK